MFTSVFLMANGQQERFGGVDAPSKQLVTVTGVPLIARTIGQVRRLSPSGTEITVVAPFTDDWRRLCSSQDVSHYVIYDHTTGLLDTIEKTAELWHGTDRVIVLLGDVIFSDRRLKDLLSTTATLRFSGRKARCGLLGGVWREELFGLSLDEFGQRQVRFTIADESMRQRVHPHTGRAGRLWNLYKELHRGGEELFVEIDDYTWDLDEPRDLTLLPLIEQCIAMEAS